MRLIMRIDLLGIALIALAVVTLGGCGGGGSHAPEGKRGPEPTATRAPERVVVAHRVGPQRVERGEAMEVLSASPCPNTGVNGTTTILIAPDVPHCAQVAPWGRLRILNSSAVPVQVRVGDYSLRLHRGQTGTIPSTVRSYLVHGGHPVRVTGALGGTIFVLIPGCVLRPERLKPGEELCFPEWLRRRGPMERG